MLHASLYEVEEVDLPALGAATGVLLLGALSLIPARRASSIEPTIALRTH
jgi:ABC-type lipoprotein release transport system permease subunit